MAPGRMTCMAPGRFHHRAPGELSTPQHYLQTCAGTRAADQSMLFIMFMVLDRADDGQL